MAQHTAYPLTFIASGAVANTAFAATIGRDTGGSIEAVIVIEVTQATGTNPYLDIVLETIENTDYFVHPDFAPSEIATDFEGISVSTSVINLTAAKLDLVVPPTSALINILAQPINYRTDGGIVTASAGGGINVLAEGNITLVESELRHFSAIRSGGVNATANVLYKTRLVRIDCNDAGSNNVKRALPVTNIGKSLRIKYRVGGTVSPTVTFSARVMLKS